MQVQELYENIGGDYEDIKSRIENDDIIKRFLLKFPNEPSYERLIKAKEDHDIKATFEATHALKGVSANLSLKKLHQNLSELTEQLRPLTDEADDELIKKVTESYEEVIAQINQL